MRTIIKIGIWLLILSGIGYISYEFLSPFFTPHAVQTTKVVSTDHSAMDMSEDKMVTYIKPKTYVGTKSAITSYLGEIQTEKNGQIYAYRNGIIDEYLVDIGDTVKKWQRVAVINPLTYTPEVTIMLAEKRAEIAIAEGEVSSAKRKLEFIKSTITNPSGNIAKAYEVKKSALDLQYDVEKTQLDTKISSLKTQLNSEKTIVTSDQINRVNGAILTLLEVFYAWNRNDLITSNTTSYDYYWWYNSNWGSLWTSDRNKIIEIPDRFHKNMKELIKFYPVKTNATEVELSKALTILEWVINDANSIYAIIHPSATSDYASNKSKLISLFSWDTGLILVHTSLSGTQDESTSSWQVGPGITSQANTNLIGIEQELRLLESEKSLLDSNKKKDLAGINGDQAMTQVDLEKLRIEAETERISAESRLAGVRNALSAVQNVIWVSYITAPFDGKITKRYVNAWESISMSTPLFDIIDNSSKNKSPRSFVRFEIPESDILEATIDKEIRFYRTAEPLRKLTAKIVRVSPAVGSAKWIIIEADIAETSYNIPVGSSIRVEMEKSGNMLLIPSASVVQSDNGDLSVFVIDAQNVVHSQLVSTERTVGLDVYISSGIMKDDMIVELPKNYTFLKDGINVDPMEKPTIATPVWWAPTMPEGHKH